MMSGAGGRENVRDVHHAQIDTTVSKARRDCRTLMAHVTKKSKLQKIGAYDMFGSTVWYVNGVRAM